MSELNVYGCDGCKYYIEDKNKCNYNVMHDGMKKPEGCMEAGDCDCYESKDSDTKLINIIKQKVENASKEELEEGLKIINNHLFALDKQSAKQEKK